MTTKNKDDPTGSREPFKVRQDDRDYSGLNIQGQELSEEDCSRSFFNGTDLIDCTFRNVSFANCEFAEAQIVRCRFDNCNFIGADLVSALVDNTEFASCNFASGEWREARLENAEFSQCSFEHTTIALCMFNETWFDKSTVLSLQHRAVAFNVFSRCKFDQDFNDAVLTARNFGTPAAKSVTDVVDNDANMTMDDLCVLNNSGQYRANLLVKATESVCSSIASGKSKRASSLLFLSKIIRVVALERRVSATTLVYLEGLITSSATNVSEQELFVIAMHTVVEIRTALFAISTELDGVSDDFPVDKIIIYFSRTYIRRQAEILKNLLGSCASVSEDSMRIEKFETGSTLIEIVTTASVTTSAVLVSLNFALRQAKITLDRLDDIKKSFGKLTGTTKIPQSRKAIQQKKRQNTILRPAGVIGNPEVADQLAPVREAIIKNGRELVELDEPVTVRILVKQTN